MALNKSSKSLTSRRVSKSDIADPNESMVSVNNSDVFGWLIFGCRFMSGAKDGPTRTEGDQLRNLIKSQCDGIFTRQSVESWGIRKDIADPDLFNHLSSQNINPHRSPSIGTLQLHIAVGEMVLSLVDSVSAPPIGQGIGSHSNSMQKHIGCVINAMNDKTSRVEFIGEQLSGNKMKWFNEDLLLTVDSKDDISVGLEINLFMWSVSGSLNPNNFHSAVSLSTVANSKQQSKKVGSCNIVLPMSSLSKGLPVNYQLPIRNGDGYRIALLSISIQSTSTAPSNSSPSELPSSSSPNSKVKQSQTSCRKYIRVEYLEGNISNNQMIASNQIDHNLVRHKEVFFESHLQLSNNWSENPRDIELIISRSGYLTSTSTQDWKISSRLSIPGDLLQILEASPTSSNNLTLCISCKDAGRLGCLEIGKARVAVPNAFFRTVGKRFEQWITFHHHIYTSSTTRDRQVFAGRVKIRLTLLTEQLDYFPSYESGGGIGMVVCRLVGMSGSRNGRSDEYSEKVIQAQLFSQISSPSNNEDRIEVDSRACQPIRFASALERLSNCELGGNVHIYSGAAAMSMTLRSELSNSSFSTTVPVMKFVPKSHDLERGANGLEILRVPELDLSLTRLGRLNDASPSKSSSTKEIRTESGTLLPAVAPRLEPKLKLEGCFVPFVEGCILLQTNQLIWTGNPPGHFLTKRPIGQHPNQLSARFSIGYPSPTFAYSVVDVLHLDNQVKSTKGIDPVIISLAVSTFDLLQQEQRVLDMPNFEPQSEFRSMLPMVVQISNDEVDSSFLNTVESVISTEDDRLYGMFYTAPLYCDALRKCATESHETLDGIHWKVVSIELFHPKIKYSVGKLEVNIAFKMNKIPRFVLEPVEKLFYGDTAFSAESARMELGLKQAFLLADADKSNFVSAAEVCLIILC
jgi:hypothetical protein